MGKKMYYTEEEAAERLGTSIEALAEYVRDSRLRVFADGARKMYRVDEVDVLAGGSAEEEIELAPTGDAVSLTEAEQPATPGKEDTVITAEGISIFDDEDLEIEAADPMAKTQIAPSIEDQVALEGVGSGSGLLDLTRESDDTSLGAEVLDHIDLEGEGAPAPTPEVAPAPEAAVVLPAETVEQVVVVPTYVEQVDSSAGLFGGIIVGCALLAGLIAVVALGANSPAPIGYLRSLRGSMAAVLVVGVVIVAIGAVLGWLAGKAAAARQAAMKQIGG
jgi:hypothetical protein